MILLFGGNGQLGRELVRASAASAVPLVALSRADVFINEIYGRYFTSNFPARTFVPVASWPMEFDIEIDCVAIE